MVGVGTTHRGQGAVPGGVGIQGLGHEALAAQRAGDAEGGRMILPTADDLHLVVAGRHQRLQSGVDLRRQGRIGHNALGDGRQPGQGWLPESDVHAPRRGQAHGHLHQVQGVQQAGRRQMISRRQPQHLLLRHARLRLRRRPWRPPHHQPRRFLAGPGRTLGRRAADAHVHRQQPAPDAGRQLRRLGQRRRRFPLPGFKEDAARSSRQQRGRWRLGRGRSRQQSPHPLPALGRVPRFWPPFGPGRPGGKASQADSAKLSAGFHVRPPLGAGHRHRLGQVTRPVDLCGRQPPRVGQGHGQVKIKGGIDQRLQRRRHAGRQKERRRRRGAPFGRRRMLIGMDEMGHAGCLQASDKGRRRRQLVRRGGVDNEQHATVVGDRAGATGDERRQRIVVVMEAGGHNLGQLLDLELRLDRDRAFPHHRHLVVVAPADGRSPQLPSPVAVRHQRPHGAHHLAGQRRQQFLPPSAHRSTLHIITMRRVTQLRKL